jgi:hypothetical protein
MAILTFLGPLDIHIAEAEVVFIHILNGFWLLMAICWAKNEVSE